MKLFNFSEKPKEIPQSHQEQPTQIPEKKYIEGEMITLIRKGGVENDWKIKSIDPGDKVVVEKREGNNMLEKTVSIEKLEEYKEEALRRFHEGNKTLKEKNDDVQIGYNEEREKKFYSFKEFDVVTVERSNGRLDKGWIIKEIIDSQKAILTKGDLKKTITLEKLATTNNKIK